MHLENTIVSLVQISLKSGLVSQKAHNNNNKKNTFNVRHSSFCYAKLYHNVESSNSRLCFPSNL